MFKIPVRDQIWEIDTPQIMGIMNITTDSFFEKSRVQTVEVALGIAEKFINQGASIIDIGGQSTRPGAQFISTKEETQKIVPIIEAIRSKFPTIFLSVDTFNSEVATEGLKAGAHIINDISCGQFDDAMLKVIADYKAGYIGMHITGDKQSMHQIPSRKDMMEDLITFFQQKKKLLAEFGINDWVIDPGFGFGKSMDENFTIVKQLGKLAALNLPILLGVSRKSSIYKTLATTPENALNGTTIVNTIGVMNGAHIIRVHDVKEAKEITTLLPKLI
jgi:dihydropteroate synthase